MKRLSKYIVLFAAAVTGLSSCTTFLTSDSPSAFTPDIVYNDPSMTEKVLMGVYAKLTEDATYSQSIAITFNCGSDIEIRSFTIDQPAGSTDRAAANYLADATNDKVTKASEALYEAIERANNLIEGIEGATSYGAGNKDIKAMHGEAIALRAQCYRDLVRMLGNVPFKMEATKPDLSNVYLPKTDRFTIMETLIDQLVKYADELPWKQPTPERVTQGYARGLAAQLALMRAGWNYSPDCQWTAPTSDAAKYYQIARDQAFKVMSEGGYSLTQATTMSDGTYIPGFENFFRNMCQRKYLSNESLYEIGFVVARSSELGYTIGPRIQTSTKTYGYATQGQIFTTPEYFYSFHPADTRRDVSVYYTEYRDLSNTGTYPNGVTSTTGISDNIIGNAQQFRIGKWDPVWMPKDFADASYAAGGKVGTGVNVCMMRYPEILLMFAEAENALNGATQLAKDALYEVRSRALPSMSHGEFETYLSGKEFQKAVEDERRWEFVGEGVRKWDLIRWGQLPEAIKKMREVNLTLVKDWVYNFEFPTVTLPDGSVKTRELPTEVYYKYDSNNEMIADINIDYNRETPTSAAYFTASTGKVWIYTQTHLQDPTDATKSLAQYIKYLDQFASGVVAEDGSFVKNGRPFYPIPATMITDYNGVISQDYGF